MGAHDGDRDARRLVAGKAVDSGCDRPERDRTKPLISRDCEA